MTKYMGIVLCDRKIIWNTLCSVKLCRLTATERSKTRSKHKRFWQNTAWFFSGQSLFQATEQHLNSTKRWKMRCRILISLWLCCSVLLVCALSPFLIGRMFLREDSWKYSANLVGSLIGPTFLREPSWKYSSKLYSGSKSLRLTCSGNIRPTGRSLPLIGWEQSSPVNGEKQK